MEKSQDSGKHSEVFNTAMHRAESALERARLWAEKSAREYAWASLLEYSKKHPNRRCELRVGMGDATLNVEGRCQGYIFTAYCGEFIGHRKIPTPQFLTDLSRAGANLGYPHDDWFLNGAWVARRGVMIEGENF